MADLIMNRNNIKPFNGEKYTIWKMRLFALFQQLKIMHVINKPIPEKITEEWQNAEDNAKSVLIQCLSDSLIYFVNKATTTKDILREMDKIYDRKSKATEILTRKKLIQMKLESDTSLIQHFAMFDEYVAEIIAAGGVMDESYQIAQLVATLPNVYDGIITAMETMPEENLTLAFVKVKLLDYELKIKNKNNDTDLKVLQVGNANEFKNNKNFKRKFTPNKFKNRLYKNKIRCHFCNKNGHIKKNCYKFINQQNNIKHDKNNKNENIVQMVNTDNSGIVFMCERNISTDNTTFIIDSGASDHIINDEKWYESYEVLKTPLKIAVAKNNTFIEATKLGQVKLITDKNVVLTLKDVLLCKDVANNILSVRKMQAADLNVNFGKTKVTISKNDDIIFECVNMSGIVKVKFKIFKEINSLVSVQYLLWHSRLGHLSRDKYNEIRNKKLFKDSKLLENINPSDVVCEACIQGKQTRLKNQKVKDRMHVKRPLFIVHTDVCGPINPPTFDDKSYFVLYIDDFTHYCVTYVIKRKSDVFETFQDFNAKASSHFNLKLVNLYLDNGREYLSNDMKEYCKTSGITYHLTVPHSPQQNGVAERMIRTLTEKARALIHDAELDKIFWGEAVKTATYLCNISPTKALKLSKTPFEMWHGKKPLLKYLRKFGSTVYVHCKVKQGKFDKKAWKGIMVGYDPNGLRVWNAETVRIEIARDVTVDEKSFKNSRPSLQLSKVQFDNNNMLSEELTHKNSDLKSSDVNAGTYEPCQKVRQKFLCEPSAPESMVRMSDDIDMGSSVKDDKIINEKLSESDTLRRSMRLKNLPKQNYNDDQDLLICSLALISDIPKLYSDIEGRIDQKQWEDAIAQEVNSLYENNTWNIVLKPTDKNIVGCRWVFTIKNDEFGNFTKYKARLVAKGFSQEYLSDFNETFAPVARLSSLRFIIALANQFDLIIHQMDVKTAFLNGTLKEDIYMEVPEGIKCNFGEVCKLNKALYGLKQAARCWYETFDKVMIEKGFKNSCVDKCIYVLDKGNIKSNIYVVLYVDDIVISTASIETMNSFKNYLMVSFKMTDLKEVKMFLGINIIKENDKISLDQTSYIKKVLEKFKMDDCKPVSTPLSTNIDYEELNKEENTEYPCRNLIGCLMYIMLCTRPDLSISVNILSRYSNKNNVELWKCLKRILRYLKGTIDMKLTYCKSNYKSILCGYVDSDWGSDTLDRKSTTGFIFKLFDVNTVCWSTKKQSSVAASSTEAEYMALFEAVKEGLWLKSLSESLCLSIVDPIIVYEDNQGCISIANNPTSH